MPPELVEPKLHLAVRAKDMLVETLPHAPKSS